MAEQNITELLRQLDEYKAVFDASPMMFWYKDTQNNLLLINRAAANLEGMPVTFLEGKSAWDLYPKEQADAFYADDLEVIGTGKPKLNIVEQHTSPASGKVMWVQTSKIPARDREGTIVGVVAFAIDITEQKELEEAVKYRLGKLRELSVDGGSAEMTGQIDEILTLLD